MQPTKQTTQKVSSLIHSPADVHRTGLADLQDQIGNDFYGVPMGIPSLDIHYVPIRPRQVEFIVAQPGAGKTGLAVSRWRQRSEAIHAAGLNRVAVYVTAEQSVEEIWRYGVAAQSSVPLDKISRGLVGEDMLRQFKKDSLLSSATLPMWVLGVSEENSLQQPRLTVENIVQALLDIKRHYRKEIDSVFVDYLQLLPNDGKLPESTLWLKTNSQTFKLSSVSCAIEHLYPFQEYNRTFARCQEATGKAASRPANPLWSEG